MNNTSNIYLRPFLPEDQDVARQLILEGLGEHFGHIDLSQNPDLDDIEANYIGAGHSFVIAEKDRQIVGTGALLSESEDTGRIARVSVTPGLRGLGIGRSIVAHLLEVGRRLGKRQIVVETNCDWYPAINLYKHCGFHEYDRDDESVHMCLEL